jgi:hypothetical protein
MKDQNSAVEATEKDCNMALELDPGNANFQELKQQIISASLGAT